MALADLSAFKAAITTPDAKNSYYKNLTGFPTASPDSIALHGMWLDTPNAGAVPSTAAACDSSTPGGIPVLAGRSTGRIITAISDATGENYIGTAGSTVYGAAGFLVDRLAHQGGLVGNLTSAQTTNLPTAALTRYTSGVGVMAAVECYAATGSTDIVTISCSYTNQAGTPGQIGSVYVGATTFRDPHVYMFSLQPGDTGVRSVESVTLANSSGTAGNFGVTLFKPLAIIPPTIAVERASLPANQIVGWNTGIHADACLQIMWNADEPLGGANVHIVIETHSV